MRDIKKKYKLYEYFNPFGYMTGMGIVVATTVLGAVAGSLWPVTLAIGILTIPNLALRHLAKEKRAKAVFQQNLEGKS